MSGETSGGIRFGNVGGGVKVTAAGDIVGHNKTTTTTTTTIKGFADDGKKQQFQAEIDELREALRAIKAQIEASSLDDDAKDETSSAILETVKELKTAKEQTAEIPPQQEAAPPIAAAVEGALDRAGTLMTKLTGLASQTGDIAESVGKFAVKYGPLLLSARHLFGLP